MTPEFGPKQLVADFFDRVTPVKFNGDSNSGITIPYHLQTGQQLIEGFYEQKRAELGALGYNLEKTNELVTEAAIDILFEENSPENSPQTATFLNRFIQRKIAAARIIITASESNKIPDLGIQETILVAAENYLKTIHAVNTSTVNAIDYITLITPHMASQKQTVEAQKLTENFESIPEYYQRKVWGFLTNADQSTAELMIEVIKTIATNAVDKKPASEAIERVLESQPKNPQLVFNLLKTYGDIHGSLSNAKVSESKIEYAFSSWPPAFLIKFLESQTDPEIVSAVLNTLVQVVTPVYAFRNVNDSTARMTSENQTLYWNFARNKIPTLVKTIARLTQEMTNHADSKKSNLVFDAMGKGISLAHDMVLTAFTDASMNAFPPNFKASIQESLEGLDKFTNDYIARGSGDSITKHEAAKNFSGSLKQLSLLLKRTYT